MIIKVVSGLFINVYNTRYLSREWSRMWRFWSGALWWPYWCIFVVECWFIYTYKGWKSAEGPPPDGSWTCDACGNVNYPFRVKCNRRNCGADKPLENKPAAAPISPPPATDQVCDIFGFMLVIMQIEPSASVGRLLHMIQCLLTCCKCYLVHLITLVSTHYIFSNVLGVLFLTSNLNICFPIHLNIVRHLKENESQ